MFERLAMAVLLSTALLVYQVSGIDGNCVSQGCAEGEDTIGLLQSKKRSEGPHIVPDDSPSGNKNPWAKSSKKKFNHHRHMHEKVIDETDYSKDCNDAYEQVKELSLADRCPGLKSMTFAEVQAVWNEKFKKMADKMEAQGANEEKRAKSLRELKRIFADSLNQGKPTIVEGSVPKQLGWVAADHWHKDELANFMGDISWDRQTFNYPDWIVGLNSHTTLKDYISHNESKGDVFLFASESGCRESSALKTVVDKLRDQFTPSPDFGYGPETCQAIIAIDGIGSSHGFHCHDPVWNTQVEGIKHWWLLEPFYGADMQDEIGLMEWGGAPKVNSSSGSHSFEYPNACAMLREVNPPPGAIKCAMKPGEMIILPDSWMHATCGLSEFTIAAGGWLSGPGKDEVKVDDGIMEAIKETI